ncbi:aminomethyltransferase [Deinobacterium chartae]|uniref:Aminomethyltransferase n=1 Tax=Deinobacterium chartae TaxID=521158 RepID=A0A841I0M3_9DEIO|nr:glycine cleavage system aminomethyltransferase GcvT [Deinobacterium chartae]MBB6098656.1 aminomethyltransferase [Deinobacterium chartae]
MTDQSALQKTPLYPAHLEANARMVEFGGWAMPVQYEGVIKEHQAVRERAAVFDVSHMGEFRVKGPGALDFLQYATPNDVSKLKPGRAQYNMLPNDRGGLVDDIYIYCLAPHEYLVVVNASNIGKDFAHLEQLRAGFDVTLSDESGAWALLAVQGPQTEALLQPHTDLDLSHHKKNAVFFAQLFGMPVMMARTGYTGEDGFEVFVEAALAERLWKALLSAGIPPAGLGARDTLRLEAGFPLYGHEFSDDLNPLQSHYGWVFKDKPHFGREALQAAPNTRELVGLRLEKAIAREGAPVLSGERVVGVVTSGTSSPTLKYPIALAYVDRDALHLGLSVEIRGKPHSAERVSVPFYRPPTR